MFNGGGIYEILNTVNGKQYIGQASNFTKRWKHHRSDLAARRHHSLPLQRAWDKYGGNAFEFNVLLICAKDKDILQMYEQQCFDALKPEYNICKIAGSTSGCVATPETRARLSALLMGNTRTKGVKQSPEACAQKSERQKGKKRPDVAAALTGLVRSPEFGAAITLRQTGRLLAAETRAKIGDAQRGKLRGPRPPNVCAAISRALSGKPGHPQSPETRKKISKATVGRQGKPHSDETRLKLSEVQKGKVLTPAHRANVGAGVRRFHAYKRLMATQGALA